MAVQDWAIRSEGKARSAENWDPLLSVIDYMNGMDEFDRTGGWSKGKREISSQTDRAAKP